MGNRQTYYKYLLELSTTKELHDFLEDLTSNEKQFLLSRLRRVLPKFINEIKRFREARR